jgi:hypothetical protein
VYKCESESPPSGGGSPFPFYKSKEREWLQREKKSARDPRDCAASPLRGGPTSPVDDDGGAPMPCPGATCDVHPKGMGGADLSGRRTGDVRPAEMGGASLRRILRLNPSMVDS